MFTSNSGKVVDLDVLILEKSSLAFMLTLSVFKNKLVRLPNFSKKIVNSLPVLATLQ